MRRMDEGLPDSLSDGLHRVTLRDGRRAIAKVRHEAPSGFFEAEARGLEALRLSETLRVPKLHAIAAHGILIEDLGSGQPSSNDWEHAGANLARMHRREAAQFGFDGDGWCGDSAQDNS